MTSSSDPRGDPSGDADALRERLAAAEARAAQLESWLTVAFEHSPVAIAIVSAKENRNVRVNDAMVALMGRSREEIMSVDPFSQVLKFTHPDDLALDQTMFGEMVVGARRSYQIEKRFIRPDGTMRVGLLTVSGEFEPPLEPSMAVGPLRFVVTQIIDITELRATTEALRKRDEELRHAQRIEGIGRLAGGIAHDFNNLLTVIAGHGEILRDLAGDGRGTISAREVSENLESMLGAADRAAALTAQLLAHGRREKVMPKTFVLSDAVGAMQRLLVRVIGSNIESAQSLLAEGAIYADQGQVGQVVMNLVLNARDAMPDGGRLTLATHDVTTGSGTEGGPDEDAQAWVTLTVSDTGQGMTPEVRERMFEPFFTTRADRPGTQGTGLGLATVQRVVSEARGRIEVKTAPGQGTSVTVFFPRVARVPRAEPAGVLTPVARTNAERLLVVEDDPSVRTLVASVLVGAHYRVAAARNGEEALSFVDDASVPFDLVITDMMMARVDGLALAKQLSLRGKAPRMIFITGYSDHAPAELAPYGELLAKPFTPKQLLETVRRVLDTAAR